MAISISYGVVQDDQTRFYTRNLTFPVLLTVRPALEVVNMDILAFNREDVSHQGPPSLEKNVREKVHKLSRKFHLCRIYLLM